MTGKRHEIDTLRITHRAHREGPVWEKLSRIYRN